MSRPRSPRGRSGQGKAFPSEVWEAIEADIEEKVRLEALASQFTYGAIAKRYGVGTSVVEKRGALVRATMEKQ